MELFIVFQFFNDLFSTKGKKIVATAVGFGFYAVAYAAFLFVNSTVVNILLCFVIDSVFAKLFFECNIKGATLGALFIAVSNTASEFIVISLLAIIASAFLTFVFYGRTSCKMDELYKTQREAERLRTDQTYYALLDQQNEMLKTITHDEKNHLIAIKALANDPAVSEYIENIYSDIKYHSMFGNTKNKFLDLLLNKYKSICDSSGISFEYNIRTANLSFMDAPDLITLLSNILDNAVEAASVSEKKTIELSINRVNEFDMLSCVNSSDRKPQSVGKSLRTSKNSGGFHGLGTKSIKAIAGKYNGEFDWSYSEADREFTVNIAFFHTDKERELVKN